MFIFNPKTLVCLIHNCTFITHNTVRWLSFWKLYTFCANHFTPDCFGNELVSTIYHHHINEIVIKYPYASSKWLKQHISNKGKLQIILSILIHFSSYCNKLLAGYFIKIYLHMSIINYPVSSIILISIINVITYSFC